jgi:hypothetical protein
MSNGNYANFEILPNGNLKISLTNEGKIELTEMQEQYKEKWSDETMLREIIEHQLCNGWDWLSAGQVGALTDSPILSNDVIYNENTDEIESADHCWWYPDYMVTDFVQALLTDGHLIFTKGD